MKLKVVEKDGVKYAVIQDDKPVYVNDDGSEVAYDAPAAKAAITRLNGEAKGHREAKEAAETKLKAFEGIDDADVARKAMQTVANLDAKKLVDAGKIDEVRAEAIKATEAKFAPVVDENKKLKGQLDSEIIGGSFARSKYITDKLAIPSDLVQARFGKHFTVGEDGKLIAKDAAGNQIYSAAKPGEVADFDEAMSIIVNAYPQKEHILKGSGGGGGGAKPGDKDTGGKTILRADFDKLDPASQMSKAREGFKIVDAA